MAIRTDPIPQNRHPAANLSRRALLTAIAGLCLAPNGVQARDFWGARLPDGPKDFLFGYGTLINGTSRAGTAGRTLESLPARVSAQFGYVRAWSARARSGWTALGLRKLKPGEAPATINGVIFPVTPTELSAFDRRESGYRRVEVPRERLEPMGWQGLPVEGRIWIYVPPGAQGAVGEGLPEPSAEFPILQSYIDVVLEGALGEGEAFAAELVATTFDWSPFWLNDREFARRPWSANRSAGAIDRLLSATPPAAAFYGDRLYGEAYAARYLLRQPARAP